MQLVAGGGGGAHGCGPVYGVVFGTQVAGIGGHAAPVVVDLGFGACGYGGAAEVYVIEVFGAESVLCQVRGGVHDLGQEVQLVLVIYLDAELGADGLDAVPHADVVQGIYAAAAAAAYEA